MFLLLSIDYNSNDSPPHSHFHSLHSSSDALHSTIHLFLIDSLPVLLGLESHLHSSVGSSGIDMQRNREEGLHDRHCWTHSQERIRHGEYSDRRMSIHRVHDNERDPGVLLRVLVIEDLSNDLSTVMFPVERHTLLDLTSPSDPTMNVVSRE